MPHALILMGLSMLTLGIIIGSNLVHYTTDYNIITSTSDYDKAIELCSNNDGLGHMKFNNQNKSTSYLNLIKCKDGAEFRFEAK